MEVISKMELWKKNLYSVWSAQFITGIGLNMVMPFLPLYLRELGVNEDQSLKIWSGVVFFFRLHGLGLHAAPLGDSGRPSRP